MARAQRHSETCGSSNPGVLRISRARFGEAALWSTSGNTPSKPPNCCPTASSSRSARSTASRSTRGCDPAGNFRRPQLIAERTPRRSCLHCRSSPWMTASRSMACPPPRNVWCPFMCTCRQAAGDVDFTSASALLIASGFALFRQPAEDGRVVEDDRVGDQFRAMVADLDLQIGVKPAG